jgi:flagellum-specific peptidoglycan hydrolase FlgJ
MSIPTYFIFRTRQALSTRAGTIARMAIPVLLLIIGELASGQAHYIKKYRPLADSLSNAYGIPAAIILGVAIMESASGTSRNCKLLNNHFGIVGKNNLLKTKGVKTRYKQYPNAHASYMDFCRVLMKRKFYKRLKHNMDYLLWADAISKANYSEIPDIWKERVIATIRKNKLSVSQWPL